MGFSVPKDMSTYSFVTQAWLGRRLSDTDQLNAPIRNLKKNNYALRLLLKFYPMQCCKTLRIKSARNYQLIILTWHLKLLAHSSVV
jgi:hypothetical protein